MKRAVVIGGKGKVGSYLVPMLVKEGYEVISVGRGGTEPKVASEAWDKVRICALDRKAADFEGDIAALGGDVVVDMICFQNEDMLRLVRALEGKVSHYLVCGSAWIHGYSGAVPVREEECRDALEEYGRQKGLMDYELARLGEQSGFPGTAVHPGHIVCPGDVPINPQGYKGLKAFELLRDGAPVSLPNFGMETVHHVHAEDVAGVFLAAIRAGKPSFGQGFHAVSPRAVTLRGYAIEVASWYGKRAELAFEPFDAWKRNVEPAQAEQTLSHILHSPSCSMDKARDLLGFAPVHSSYAAVRECVASFGL